jgi:hypothetical protein
MLHSGLRYTDYIDTVVDAPYPLYVIGPPRYARNEDNMRRTNALISDVLKLWKDYDDPDHYYAKYIQQLERQYENNKKRINHSIS